MAYRVYRVGGAVRDELLGLEPRETDWVVVGGSPEDLLEQGYRQVGASFPVFLHPETGDEYALARTEKKEGHGYHGFAVEFHPGVTLEEDLLRRDLTVNAMARDEAGNIIDPYGGRADLEGRVLRHVSPAFREDPLRVLRVARFAARLAPLGFTVHRATISLMREITDSGELEHLASERVWTEVAGAMAAARPGVFVDVLRSCGALEALLPEVETLFGVPQPEKYHPEIDTGLHVTMAMNLAAGEGWPPEVVYALLLHDLGKGLTPSGELPSHVRHEQRGVALARRVCERLRTPNAWTDLALKVTGLHLRCHRLTEMKPATKLKLIEEADLLRRPEMLESFVRACEADYRGRGGFEERDYPQARILKDSLEAALSVRARDLDTEGLKGSQVGNLLRKARISAIADIADRSG
jgi:tRNA nucleotidyltransferase (CCA-adding enzyme)